MPFSYEYPRPMVTVDVIVTRHTKSVTEVLLIQRLRSPCQGMWALPGGFIEMHETLSESAARELAEETGLQIPTDQLTQQSVFGDPGRDPRGRTVSVVFSVSVDEQQISILAAGDDAAEIGWHPLDRLPPLAFDHTDILNDFLQNNTDINSRYQDDFAAQ